MSCIIAKTHPMQTIIAMMMSETGLVITAIKNEM
jgi:hypothetical protein